jgi:hypothetical protein
MNTPDTDVRIRALEYEVQTLRTLLTALQGRVAELSTSATPQTAHTTWDISEADIFDTGVEPRRVRP